MAEAQLRRLSPSDIERNPDNPRLFFRDEDMDPLIESIAQVGILVPLTVYRNEDGKYQLLDGERRWRAARKLNLQFVPVIVQRKPDRLENILRMFNIHNVRKEWDQLASALKLGTVIGLVRQQRGDEPTTKELASLTGLTPAAVRRLQDLLALPDEHKAIIREELKKPKADQKLTEDFFFELQKAIKTIRRYEPGFFEEILEKRFANSLIRKYRENLIPSIIAFRNVSRIARGEKEGVPERRIRAALVRLATDPQYTIEKAFEATVEHPLWEKELRRHITDLRAKLQELEGEQLEEDLAESLRELAGFIQKNWR